jgi:hypothetical protein
VLGLSTSAGGAAAGTAFTTFNLVNRGPADCQLDGYPTLTFYGPSGAGGAGAGPKLSITAIDSGPPAHPVTLASNGAAEFILVYHEVPVGGVGCQSVASVGVALPNSTERLMTPLSVSVCGGNAEVYAFGKPGTESP